MGEWEVMETYPYLLLKTQEQVFTACSAKVCVLLFSSSALGPIYLLLKIDAPYGAHTHFAFELCNGHVLCIILKGSSHPP
jgi:hypothetical protein